MVIFGKEERKITDQYALVSGGQSRSDWSVIFANSV